MTDMHAVHDPNRFVDTGTAAQTPGALGFGLILSSSPVKLWIDDTGGVTVFSAE